MSYEDPSEPPIRGLIAPARDCHWKKCVQIGFKPDNLNLYEWMDLHLSGDRETWHFYFWEGAQKAVPIVSHPAKVPHEINPFAGEPPTHESAMAYIYGRGQ